MPHHVYKLYTVAVPGAQAHLKGTGGSLKKFVGWIVEVVRASSRSRQKVWSPVVLQQVKEKKAGIPV